MPRTPRASHGTGLRCPADEITKTLEVIMYRWHWYRKFILQLAPAAAGKPIDRLAGHQPDRRAQQAEIMALARLRRRDDIVLRRAG